MYGLFLMLFELVAWTAELFAGVNTGMCVAGSYSSPACLGGTPNIYANMPVNFTVAYLADQGLGPNSVSVLQLIKREQAEIVIHSGDLDYNDNPSEWDSQINEILGEYYPYFTVLGNHEMGYPSLVYEYQQLIYNRLRRINITTCSGEIGVNLVCSYNGLLVVFTSQGLMGADHESFVASSFETYPAKWRVCSWHLNQHLMQIGGKEDEVGWDIYETCREQAAMIMTGHEHTYARSYVMTDIETQQLLNTNDTLTLQKGQSFVIQNGIGGKDVRDWDTDLRSNPWWASTHASDDGLKAGALFCQYNYNNQSNVAYCYFKQHDDVVRDTFTIISNL